MSQAKPDPQADTASELAKVLRTIRPTWAFVASWTERGVRLSWYDTQSSHGPTYSAFGNSETQAVQSFLANPTNRRVWE